LAKVGYERMQEMADPSQGLGRARENWLGKSDGITLLRGVFEVWYLKAA